MEVIGAPASVQLKGGHLGGERLMFKMTRVISLNSSSLHGTERGLHRGGRGTEQKNRDVLVKEKRRINQVEFSSGQRIKSAFKY